ncbi:hypothetical protein GCM10009838_75910 [Catenulispora subtropica]|uniref:Uncharacterized protein n=1 Tax=Catenulispora subtropica TaxID=450798 RepID=A0ABN2T5Z9_9ACTN
MPFAPTKYAFAGGLLAAAVAPAPLAAPAGSAAYADNGAAAIPTAARNTAALIRHRLRFSVVPPVTEPLSFSRPLIRDGAGRVCAAPSRAMLSPRSA